MTMTEMMRVCVAVFKLKIHMMCARKRLDALAAYVVNGIKSLAPRLKRHCTITYIIPTIAAVCGISLSGTGLAYTAYATFSESVEVIDTASYTVKDRIYLGPLNGHLTVTPDGKRLYVVASVSPLLYVIDTNTSAIEATITFDTNDRWLGRPVITPNGRYLYIALQTAEGFSNTFAIIDTATNTVVDKLILPFNVNRQHCELLFAPDGKRAYVIHDEGGAVSVVDMISNTVISTLELILDIIDQYGNPYTVNFGAWSAQLSQDGNIIYLMTFIYDNEFCIKDKEIACFIGCVKISTTTHDVISKMPMPKSLLYHYGRSLISLTPNGKIGYISDYANDYLLVLDTLSNRVVTKIQTNPPALGTIAITPDGKYAYAAFPPMGIQVIDTASNTILGKVSEAGFALGGIVIAPEASPPSISQSPTSGPPGTTYHQWGTGFTPETIAVVHLKRPDGSEETSWNQPIDGSGRFEVAYTAPWDQPLGTYTWWVVDGATGAKSNELSSDVVRNSKSTLSGQVFDDNASTPLAGASVKFSGKTATTDEGGNYSLSNLYDGAYAVKVTKQGYSPLTEEVYIAPSSSTRKDFWLSPVNENAITVTGVTSRYGGQVYFLEGFDQSATFTATVDWAGHPAGVVRFTTSTGVHEVAASSNKASLLINIGQEFQQCGALKVKAISSDGEASAEVPAEVGIMSDPFSMLHVSYGVTDMGDSFKYQFKYGANMDFFDEGVDAGVIDKDIPIFGAKAFRLQFYPTMSGEVESNGHAELRFEWDNLEAGQLMRREWGRTHNLKKMQALLDDFLAKGRLDRRRLPKVAVAGDEISLFPYLQFEGDFANKSCDWKWSGELGIAGQSEFKKSWPFICMAGPVPIPMYAKMSLSTAADLGVALTEIEPLILNGNFRLEPDARGSLGAGVDSVLAVEGWLGGGAQMGLQWPAKPALHELDVYLNGGVSVYALMWKWEKELLKYEWSLLGSSGRTTLLLPKLGPVAPTLVSRSYLSSPRYGRFGGAAQLRTNRLLQEGAAYTTSSAPLQSTVFPHSETTIAASGSKLDLAWLYDNPSRSSTNRTMAVWSRWNGTSWSSPKPIKDDGTADFHPDLLTLPTGVVFAAWEDESIVQPDTAQFEDMVKDLEISVARYNPTKKIWAEAKRLTANGYLDRSPKLGGVSANNIMVTWVANTANDILGNATSPNILWFSKWNGSKWSAPKSFATVPYGLLKYDLLYDGSKGLLVMSLDTDNDPATINDHELFAVEYASGQWGALQRLTDDNESDDNPHLTMLSAGTSLLAWMKGGSLVTAKDLEMSSRVTVWEDQYSSNLADFKMASDQNGTLALVWAEPTDYASDIYAVFFDRAFDLWGQPQRLTADVQSKQYLAPAFTSTKNLMVVYDQTLVTATPVEHLTSTGKTFTFAAPKAGLTDLYTLIYAVGGDLALDEWSFIATPLNPHPGEAVTLTVKVVNVGDKTAANIPVALYRGSPATSGTEIGRATVAGPLRPGETAEVGLEWTVPTKNIPSGVYAVVDPDRQFADKDRTNNKVKHSLVLPDLAIQALTWSRVAENLFEVTARVISQGAVAAEATDIRFRKGGPEGELVATQNIPKLAVSRSYDALARIAIDGNATEELLVYATVDEEQKITEFDEENNRTTVLIETH